MDGLKWMVKNVVCDKAAGMNDQGPNRRKACCPPGMLVTIPGGRGCSSAHACLSLVRASMGSSVPSGRPDLSAGLAVY